MTHDRSPAPSPVPQRRTLPRSWWGHTLSTAAAIVLGFGTLLSIRYVARPIALFVVAVSIAEGLAPVVSRLERHIRRGPAVVLVYLTLAAAAALLASLIVPALVAQAEALVLSAPALAERARAWMARENTALGVQLSVVFAELPRRLGDLLVATPVRAFRGFVETLLVVFLSVYWLLGAPALQRFALSLVRERQRPAARDVLRAMGRSMGGYVRGTAINAVIVGALAWIGLTVIGVPYALMLGTLTMLLEPVPFLGPILAAVPVVMIAYAVRPPLALLALGLYTILHQIEGHLLTPNIMRRQTDVPQTLVIFALLAGGVVGGLLGVLAAIPLAAALHVLTVRVIAPTIRRKTGADVDDLARADPADAALAAPPAGTPRGGPGSESIGEEDAT